MAKMISLFGSVSSSRSELMRVGEVQCHWLTLNEAFMAWLRIIAPFPLRCLLGQCNFSINSKKPDRHQRRRTHTQQEMHPTGTYRRKIWTYAEFHCLSILQVSKVTICCWKPVQTISFDLFFAVPSNKCKILRKQLYLLRLLYHL